MMFKLFWKNFKQQFPNYLVYFISMTFAVVVYYCFSAITYNRELVARVGQEIHINGAMNLGGILVVIMILGFMFAANHFFLVKRKKEIGLYQLVGMRKSQLSFLFFVETLVLGAASLITGVGLGIIFSKLFSMILAKAMFLKVASLFFISVPSMVQTTSVFIFMLLAVSIRSSWVIHRYQVANLFKPAEKNDTYPYQLTKVKIVLGIVGILLIGAGYALAYNVIAVSTLFTRTQVGFASFILVPLVILLLCMIGTSLFFKYTMHVLVSILAQRKNSYYHNLNMLALGNTKRHIQKSGTTLAAVTIFIAISLGMIGGAASFYTIGMNSVDADAPTDFIVAQNTFKDVKQLIENEPNTRIRSVVTLRYKLVGSLFRLKIGQEQNERTVEPVNFLSLSNYRAYQKINPYLKDIELREEQDTVVFDRIQKILGGSIRYESLFKLEDGTHLHVTEIRQNYLGQNLLNYSFPILVVSDTQYQKITSGVRYSLRAFNVKTKNEDALTDTLSEKVKPNWVAPVYYDYQLVNNRIAGYIGEKSRFDNQKKEEENTEQEFWQLNYTNRFSDLRYERREMGLFIYVAMFLGILALIITGSILMLQQFSEAELEKESYDLLRKIGVPRAEITRLVYQQNSIFFFPPMIIGVLHAGFAIFVFSAFISSSGYWLAYLACGLLILIYLGCYFLTSAIYTQIIRGKEQ